MQLAFDSNPDIKALLVVSHRALKSWDFVRLNCGMPYTAEIDQALRQLGAIIHGLSG